MFQPRALSGAVLLLLVCSFKNLPAQTCRLSVAGLNQNRFVWGPVHAECGWEGVCWHTPPFGNWGVTSNYGQRQDGTQFQGWKGTGWKKQWNSCTFYEWAPPNDKYYNWNNWTQQTTWGEPVNVHGTKSVAAQVNCPRDTNGDGQCDAGGCKDVYAYGEWTNWMGLYELDLCGPDDLVETLHFPATEVNLVCAPGWCSAAGTAWQAPTSGWVTYAQMAMVVNYGVYEDSVNCEYLRFSNPQYNCLW